MKVTLKSEDVFWHNLNQSIQITLPPLGTVYFRSEEDMQMKNMIKKVIKKRIEKVKLNGNRSKQRQKAKAYALK